MTTQPGILKVPAARAAGALGKSPHAWHLLTLTLVATDGLFLAGAFAAAYLIRFEAELPLLESLPPRLEFYSSVAFWAIPLWIVLFALYRLYDQRYLFYGLQEYVRLVNACTIGLLAIIVISFVDISLVISRGWLLLVWGLSILLLGFARFGFRRVLRRLRARGLFTVPTVIVGTNEEAVTLAEQFLADPSSGARVIGFADSSVPAGTPIVGRLTVLGGLQDLERLVGTGGACQIVVATSALSRADLLDLYRTLGHAEGVEIRLASGLFEILTTGVRLDEISSVPLVTPQRIRITGVDAVLKTLFDYAAALFLLVVLSPLMLGVAVLIKRDSPGPVFHRRQVLGRGGKTFTAFKFRTMVASAEAHLAADSELARSFAACYKLKDDPRVTRLGRLLRRTSIDELPQLLNVLRGEMSLVGPRMIAPDEAERYGKWQLNLLTVKPGITGPWQVWGRSELPYEERVRLSMHYIRNYTIWLDLAILLRTVWVVLRCRGAY